MPPTFFNTKKMNLKEFFEYQLKNTTVIVTEEELKKNPNQKFYSGRKIEVGDKVLVGLILEPDPITKLPTKVITLHEDELETIYVQDERMTKEKIGIDVPVLKKLK